MCGIVGAISFKDEPVNALIKKQFLSQRLRGTQGFGLFDYEYKNIVKETQEENILKWLDKYPSSNILFHHRLPTSTANVKSAAHPFSTKDFFKTNYVLVHNGIIGNDLELMAEHAKLGIAYQSIQPDGSFNDSEALLWDVALYLEGKQEKLNVEGSVAFVCIAMGKGNKHDRMWFARNTSPLNMFQDDEAGIMLSSEGAGEAIDRDTLYSFDYVNHKLTTKDCTILTGWENYQATTPYSSDTAYNRRGFTSYDEYWNRWADQDEELLELDPDYDYGGATAKEGKQYLRFFKADKVLVNGEVSQIYQQVIWIHQGLYDEAMDQIQYEYDCLCLLYDEYEAKGIPTVDVKYSLKLYERVEARLDSELYETEYGEKNTKLITRGGAE